MTKVLTLNGCELVLAAILGRLFLTLSKPRTTPLQTAQFGPTA